MHPFKKKSQPKVEHIICFSFDADKLYWALVRHELTTGFQLLHCELIEKFNPQHLNLELMNLHKKYKLMKAIYHWILTPQQYHLLTMDDEHLTEEELRSSARWRIKNFINYPPEKALIDVFSIPPHGPGLQRKRHFAVVTEQNFLLKVREDLDNMGITLSMISIQELALRNLLSPLTTMPVQALLFESAANYTLLFSSSENLFMIRHIDKTAIMQDLILEVQRSLDYLRGQMHVTNPDHLYLACQNNQAIKEAISVQLKLACSALAVEARVEGTENTAPYFYPVVGGAMEEVLHARAH